MLVLRAEPLLDPDRVRHGAVQRLLHVCLRVRLDDTTCLGNCGAKASPDCWTCVAQDSCGQCDDACGAGDGGTASDGAAPPPDAFIAAEVGGGDGACNLPSPDTTWLPVGTATSDKPTTVTSGGSTGNGTATITCMVHPSGNGFDIDLSVTVAGTPGGNVTISSPAGEGAVTMYGGTGITASFTRGTMGPYASNACTLHVHVRGSARSREPRRRGRAHLGAHRLPRGRGTGQTTTGPDGGVTPVACPESADFLFEQCNQ